MNPKLAEERIEPALIAIYVAVGLLGTIIVAVILAIPITLIWAVVRLVLHYT